MLEVLDCDQGSEAWYVARLGLPTASEFGTVLAQGRKAGEASVTRRKYMLSLIAEQLTGEPCKRFAGNKDTERGHEHEAEQRKVYQLIRQTDVERVGFIRNGRVGCSPDGLIGNDGMFEGKSKEPHLVLDMVLKGDEATLEKAHICQCQGSLWVAEREWIDYMAYWPNLPPFLRRLHRDEQRIKEIQLGVDIFLNEMHELMEKLEQRAAA